MRSNEERNQRILDLWGIYSYSLIAQRVGTTRSVVAAVIWRARHPTKEYRVSHNKNGKGRHGNGPYADYTLLNKDI